MHPARGAAFKIEGPPENGDAAPTANRDGADLRNNKKQLGSASTFNKYERRATSSTGKEPGQRKKGLKQIVDDRFADEIPAKQARHWEIALHYDGRFAWDDRDDPGR